MEKLKITTLLAFILFPWLLIAQTCGDIICTPKEVCVGSTNFSLNLCTPLGGVYSGSIYIDPVENQFKPEEVGDYILTYTVNNNTCHVTVKVVPPSTLGTISGDVKVCKGETGTFYANGIQNAESYVWNFNTTFIPTTSPKLDLPFSANFDYQSISLTVTGKSNACGEGTPSFPAFAVAIISKPSSLSITGLKSVCKNEQSTYSASGYAKYKWSVYDADDLILGYDTSSTIKVAWSNKDISVLQLRVWNEDGCYGDTSINITKGAGTAPDPSEIWQFGYNLLVCSDSTSGISYQWYNNNVAKSTLSYYYCPDADINGEIYVKTSNGSCSSESAKIKVSKQPGGFKSNSIDARFSIYPNPVSDKLVIRRLVPESEIFSYRLLDIYGKQQLAGYGSGLETGIDVSGLSAGVYFIRIDNGQSGTETYKIIKNR